VINGLGSWTSSSFEDTLDSSSVLELINCDCLSSDCSVVKWIFLNTYASKLFAIDLDTPGILSIQI
jgi:hypothetical protein